MQFNSWRISKNRNFSKAVLLWSLTGRQLDGIHYAMSFLETWQKVQQGNQIDHLKLSAEGKDVIVIGGGDTGCDCIATSLRQVG